MIIRLKRDISNIELMDDYDFKAAYEEGETKQSVIDTINSNISALAAEQQNAPSQADKIPADPIFKRNDGGDEEIRLSSQVGDSIYNLEISKINNGVGLYIVYELVKSGEDPERAAITEQEAASYAQDFLAGLGLQDKYIIDQLKPAAAKDANKQFQLLNNPGILSEQFYICDLTRTYGGVPVNRAEQGVAVSGESSKAYGYFPPQEAMQLIVDGAGVVSLYWRNPEEILETLNGNVALLPFEEIQDAICNSEVYSSYFQEDEAIKKIAVSSVSLGYMRVKAPNASNTYLVIPVWDVIGRIERGEGNEAHSLPSHSYLTINAMDGSVINRALGY